ncbi:Pycsar system effector family protein [Ascidiimonas aurantiaca]|uniref:Pycsar system effector family protein n=1 Tax=Ascidiimonas aurantiaca TaxID=1685432 RepID=UPI0030EDEBDB
MKIQQVEEFVTKYLTEKLHPEHVFHSLDRTKEVVSRTEELLENSEIKNVDKSITLLAAWFLHVGFAKDYHSHVKQSCMLAEDYLSGEDAPKADYNKVHSLIVSAWDEEEPISNEAKILRDARTAFYGSKDFKELIELKRMELAHFEADVPTLTEWMEYFLKILRGRHHYFTKYANENWTEQKEKNSIALVGAIKKVKKKKKKEKLKVKLKNQSPERAIQSLYRIQLRNHIKLSDIADTKANILLSVNAIIISLLLANLLPRLGRPENSYLIYPTVIFVIFSIASMIMSVLATRPKIENAKLIKKELADAEVNYLFFGNFYSLELKDFKKKIGSIIQSKESVYESLTMDLYYLGKVLKKKYQLLRWTYTVFIIGIVLSVLAFAIALKYFGMGEQILDAVTPKAQ